MAFEHHPLVSIVIPFYNRSFTMLSCLEKIKGQTYDQYEIIAVDDGSTEKYDFSLINEKVDKLIRLKKNRGPGYARKIGRENAKGDFIVYLDSDDWWSSNFLEKCVESLLQYPECGMVFTNTMQSRNGIVVEERLMGKIPNKILPSLFKKRAWSTSASVWRKEVSLPECWKPFRDHEDYLHEVLCASINNNLRVVKEAVTYKDASELIQTRYHNNDLIKSLSAIVRYTQEDMTKGLFTFLINKINVRAVRIDYGCFITLLKAIQREKNKRLKRFCLMVFLFALNNLNINSFRYRVINNLRRD